MQAVAWLNSSYALPYACMLLILGPLCDYTGRRLMILFAQVMLVLGLILAAVAPDYQTLLASRVLMGAFAGAVIPAAMAYIGDRIGLPDRQVALSRILLFSIFGQLAGALLSGFLADLVSWRATFQLIAVIAFGVMFCTYRYLDHDTGAQQQLGIRMLIDGYQRVLRKPFSSVIYLIVLIEGFLIFGVFPFVALVIDSGDSKGSVQAGMILAAFGVGGLCYGLLAPTMVARFPQRMLLSVGAVLAGTGYLLGAFSAGNWFVMALLFLVTGFGFYTFHNVIQTHGTELAPSVRGTALALFASAFFLGQALGPVVAGGIVEFAGHQSLFVLHGGLLLVLGLVTARLLGGYR